MGMLEMQGIANIVSQTSGTIEEMNAFAEDWLYKNQRPINGGPQGKGLTSFQLTNDGFTQRNFRYIEDEGRKIAAILTERSFTLDKGGRTEIYEKNLHIVIEE